MKDTDALMSALLAAALFGSKQEEQKTEADKEKVRRVAEDAGNYYYHIYLGYKDAGFTDEQAFKLLLETIRRNK